MCLVGDRVVLRDWRAEDADELAGWMVPGQRWKEPDAPYYPLPAPERIAEIIGARRALAISTQLPTPREKLVIADPAADRLIGVVSWYFESEPTDWRRIGIVIYDPGHWGGGRGTEAIRLWTSYLFDTTAIARLDFATWSGNPAMIAVGRSLGFVEEARFRQARVVAGKRYDSVVMGVLRTEWERR